MNGDQGHDVAPTHLRGQMRAAAPRPGAARASSALELNAHLCSLTAAGASTRLNLIASESEPATALGDKGLPF